METILFGFLGLLTGYILVAIPQSIYAPGARTIKAVMKWGKLHTFIENVEGKKIYKAASIAGGKSKWDLIDLTAGEKKRWNVYFFLWPIYSIHKYNLSYTKAIKMGEEQDGDIIIWTDLKAKESVISRSGISDHLEFRAEYPTITADLDTEELAAVTTYTNNILEVENPALAMFGIKSWYISSAEMLNGALGGIVASKSLHDLNQLKSKIAITFTGTQIPITFSEKMKDEVNKKDDTHPGLGNIGFKLFKSIFKDFNPSDDKAKRLMDSYANVTIATEEGKAVLITAQNAKLAQLEKANGEAESHEINQRKIVEWRKKYLIDTGLAKTDQAGNIIELVPDANVKAGAEAMGKLAAITGTLVLDSGTLNKMININPKGD